jgi:Transposase and inactivated derivatives
MESAVNRGMERRQEEPVENVGLDEKSFGKGHDYVSILTDIDRSRVLEVAPERTIAATDTLWKTLSETQLSSIRSVAMDMWQAFMSSTAKNVPDAKIVHDKFHIAKYLGEAVDKVRRAEHRELKKEGDSPLTGLRQLLLYNEENSTRTASTKC